MLRNRLLYILLAVCVAFVSLNLSDVDANKKKNKGKARDLVGLLQTVTSANENVGELSADLLAATNNMTSALEVKKAHEQRTLTLQGIKTFQQGELKRLKSKLSTEQGKRDEVRRKIAELQAQLREAGSDSAHTLRQQIEGRRSELDSIDNDIEGIEDDINDKEDDIDKTDERITQSQSAEAQAQGLASFWAAQAANLATQVQNAINVLQNALDAYNAAVTAIANEAAAEENDDNDGGDDT